MANKFDFCFEWFIGSCVIFQMLEMTICQVHCLLSWNFCFYIAELEWLEWFEQNPFLVLWNKLGLKICANAIGLVSLFEQRLEIFDHCTKITY